MLLTSGECVFNDYKHTGSASKELIFFFLIPDKLAQEGNFFVNVLALESLDHVHYVNSPLH